MMITNKELFHPFRDFHKWVSDKFYITSCDPCNSKFDYLEVEHLYMQLELEVSRVKLFGSIVVVWIPYKSDYLEGFPT